ncbi:MAG: ABC transporter permease, partial [Parasporobacterium sp.]|nr:ABC transporter permease [Parasporobacterium sp.]
MKVIFHFYLFECKRAFGHFKRIFPVLIIFGLLCIFIGSIVSSLNKEKEPVAPFQVVVSIPKEAGFHYSLAFGMVTSMDSFQSLCQVTRVNSEEEAINALENGSAKAAVIIPNGLIHGIMYDQNIPAKVLYPSTPSIETVLFRNLIDALSNMLGNAQAGVYALYDIYDKYGASEDIQTRANSELNGIYIDMVL